MNALVIGPPQGLAGPVADALRRQGRSVLRAIAADAGGPERIEWLLEESGRPSLIVVFDTAPYLVVHDLLAATDADVVLVAEQRAAVARPLGVSPRSYTPRDAGGLKVVTLARAGQRWLQLGGTRSEPLGARRAAAVVLRACPLPRVAVRP